MNLIPDVIRGYGPGSPPGCERVTHFAKLDGTPASLLAMPGQALNTEH
jgi:hypothetical protein